MRVARGSEGALHGQFFSVQEVVVFGREVGGTDLQRSYASLYADTITMVLHVCELRECSRVGDCLLYANGAGKLNYYVGGEVITLGHLDR
jgi:hypothetical protein